MTEPKDLIGMKCPWSFNQWSDWHNRVLSLCPYKTCPYFDGKYDGIICLAYDGYRKKDGRLERWNFNRIVDMKNGINRPINKKRQKNG